MDNMPDPSAPMPKRFGFIFWVCIIVGVLLSFATARVWSNGQWTGEAQGYAVGCMLFPALIAYLFAGRKKVRNPDIFGLWFCGSSLLFFLLELSHHVHS
jgi:hypothetical protein